jgi:hypothetical protein
MYCNCNSKLIPVTNTIDNKERLVDVFRSNVRKRGEAAILIERLQSQFPGSRVNFDLSDCDKILRVEGENIPSERVIELLDSYGYQAELL